MKKHYPANLKAYMLPLTLILMALPAHTATAAQERRDNAAESGAEKAKDEIKPKVLLRNFPAHLTVNA